MKTLYDLFKNSVLIEDEFWFEVTLMFDQWLIDKGWIEFLE